MKPINFKGTNIIFGENQDEYQNLPAIRLPDGEIITCWEFTEDEIYDLVQNKCIYLKQLTFNNKLQPILPLINLEDGYTFEL